MRRSHAGRHGRGGASQGLIYRKTVPLARTIRQPAPQIVHNTVHQTVVHLHQTTYQHVHHRCTAAGSGITELIVRQAPAHPRPEDSIDPSRPTLVASKLLRVLSTESAQKILQPFFCRIVQHFLEQEREVWRSRPSQHPPAVRPGLSGAEFQALVRSVTDAIGRRDRMNMLRRGGNA